jgi:hypothetical protein
MQSANCRRMLKRFNNARSLLDYLASNLSVSLWKNTGKTLDKRWKKEIFPADFAAIFALLFSASSSA